MMKKIFKPFLLVTAFSFVLVAGFIIWTILTTYQCHGFIEQYPWMESICFYEDPELESLIEKRLMEIGDSIVNLPDESNG